MAKKPGLGERACPKCKETIKADAEICKHCKTSFTPDEVEAAKKEAKSTTRAFGVGCLLLVLALGFCTYAIGDDEKPATAISNSVGSSEIETESAAPPQPESNLTAPQQNAVRSAQQYLSMTGFSREGLIQQLSSDAGEGYSVADATAAVDSLDVDYNEQAARAAQKYLEMTGFSCNGLIEQLSSDAGDQYTRSQAEFGARQAGAC